MTEPVHLDRHLAAVDDPEFPEERPEPETPELIAERAILGTAVQSKEGASEALAALRPQHFSRNAHRVVFEAVERLADKGFPVDEKLDKELGKAVAFQSAVLGELAAAGMLSKVGVPGLGTGGVFLHSLTQRAGNIAYHAPAVLAAAVQRNVQAVLSSCQQIATAPGFDPDSHLEQIRKLVEDATGYAGTSALQTQSELMGEVIGRLEEQVEPGLPTGLVDLDALIGGLQPGKLVVIAARPGVGKSVLCINIADHVSGRAGAPVLFCSLEMSAEELAHRRIANAAKVPLHLIVNRLLEEQEWDRITRAFDRLAASELRIDDTPNVSLAQIRGRLREMARTGCAARLVIIDYLGLLAEPKSESRQQAVAALARGCKNLAREFQIPVVLAAQLNRGPEHRQDKKPMMADLRESGEIEAAADVVILLHREDAYDRESPRAGETDLIVCKNRQGPQATITAAFQGHYARLADMAPAWSPSSSVGGAS
jgi:replicative DNA helicase